MYASPAPAHWRICCTSAVLAAASLGPCLPASAATPASAASSARADGAAPAARHAPARAATKGRPQAAEPTEPLNQAQLDVSMRVLTGDADCEFNQKVVVEPLQGRPGHFRVSFKKVTYTMTPKETSTGAVRLEDPRAGIVWLQIPTKSMLMNTRLGQRMVDGCMHAEQRAAVAAAEAAARSPETRAAALPDAASAPSAAPAASSGTQ